MGLFGDFFRAVGRTVGRVVETVGDAIGSTTISDLGWKIQDACALSRIPQIRGIH